MAVRNFTGATEKGRPSPIYSEGAFRRLDDTDDAEFYATDRFVNHLDSLALRTIERLAGTLIVEKNPLILDLMAGWDSHIPGTIAPARVVGLSLSRNELAKNTTLAEYVIHDLNRDPNLPFPEKMFDAVINTVSVDYMTDPVAVFRDVGRILKPGGLFLVIFSNRMFPRKAVMVWRQASEEERIIMVEEFFQEAGLFEATHLFTSKGKPRPKDDKYAHLHIPSDPVYAVYADRKGGGEGMQERPVVHLFRDGAPDRREVERKKTVVKNTLACPYCDEKLTKWVVPDSPFGQTWDSEFMYICFNDACSYYVGGWDHMCSEGNRGVSYRLMYNAEKDVCLPIPVPSAQALREGIA
jgi:SAM-dependent methyltransferase